MPSQWTSNKNSEHQSSLEPLRWWNIDAPGGWHALSQQKEGRKFCIPSRPQPMWILYSKTLIANTALSELCQSFQCIIKPVCECVLSCFSGIWLFAILWTVGHQGSSVHGDSPGKNTGVGCQALHQGNLSNAGIEPTCLTSPSLAGGFFTTRATWEVLHTQWRVQRPAIPTETRCCIIHCYHHLQADVSL